MLRFVCDYRVTSFSTAHLVHTTPSQPCAAQPQTPELPCPAQTMPTALQTSCASNKLTNRAPNQLCRRRPASALSQSSSTRSRPPSALARPASALDAYVADRREVSVRAGSRLRPGEVRTCRYLATKHKAVSNNKALCLTLTGSGTVTQGGVAV